MTSMALTIRATEAAAEPVPAYEGPGVPDEQGGSGGTALNLIWPMNDEERTKLLDDLCAEQGF
jgi:hypothetical protein